MTYSFYDGNVFMAKAALQSLDKIITAAENHPNAANFLTARLIDDMKPLTFQFFYASSQALSLAAKVSGQTYIDPDKESEGVDYTYEKAHERVREAVAALEATDKDTVNRIAETLGTHPRQGQTVEAPIKAVAGLVYMPNIYFHVNMAYAILRKEGVPLAKRNWSRSFVVDYI